MYNSISRVIGFLPLFLATSPWRQFQFEAENGRLQNCPRLLGHTIQHSFPSRGIGLLVRLSEPLDLSVVLLKKKLKTKKTAPPILLRLLSVPYDNRY
jgi:hypothetical protein